MSDKQIPPAATYRDRSSGTVGSIKKAMLILRCFSAAEPLLSITELSRRVGLHKSSVSRIVSTLEEAQFVERDPATGLIRVGGGIVALAAPIMERFGLSDIVQAKLRELAIATEETTSFNIWDGTAAVSIQQVRGPNAVSHYGQLGLRKPAHCTATGKLLLAFSSEDVQKRVLLLPMTKLTENTIVDRAILQEQLELARSSNFAVNRGEFYFDVGAVASAVRGADGSVIGALEVTVPMYRFVENRIPFLQEKIINMAACLSNKLSGS